MHPYHYQFPPHILPSHSPPKPNSLLSRSYSHSTHITLPSHPPLTPFQCTLTRPAHSPLAPLSFPSDSTFTRCSLFYFVDFFLLSSHLPSHSSHCLSLPLYCPLTASHSPFYCPRTVHSLTSHPHAPPPLLPSHSPFTALALPTHCPLTPLLLPSHCPFTRLPLSNPPRSHLSEYPLNSLLIAFHSLIRLPFSISRPLSDHEPLQWHLEYYNR